MLWTLIAFGVTLWFLSKFAFPRIQEALDKRQKAIEESIDASEHAKAEAAELLREYRERLQEARKQAEEIVARVAPRRRGGRARVARGRPPPARGAARADPPRHRGGDPARDPGDPQRGRRPHGARDREGDAQGADRARTSAGWCRRRSASSTSRRSARATERAGSEWRRSPRSTRGRCSRSRKEHGKLDRIRDELAAVRGRARAEPRPGGVLLLALLLDRGEGGRAAARDRGRGPDARELPRAADREAPHAGDLPRAAAVRRALRPRAQAAAGRGDERRASSTLPSCRRSSSASASRPARTCSWRATWTRTSSAGSCCESAIPFLTPRSGTAWSN